MDFSNQDTIVSIAQQRASKHPDWNYITFLEDGDALEAKLSYGELNQSAKKVAGWLQNQGLSKGDRALVLLPNGLEFVQIFYGCLYSGVLAVPLSHQLQAYKDILLPNLKISKPKILITTNQVADFLRSRLSSDLEEFSSMKIVSADEILEQKENPYHDAGIQSEDPAYLQFSGGSTGAPKGIIVGHSNIVANMEQSGIFGQWEEQRGTSLWLPLFHDFGLAAGLIGSLYCGGFVVLMTPIHFILKPLRWLQAMSKYKCGYSYAPPFGFDMCMRKITPEDLEGLDLSSMVSIVIGAEPVHYTATKEFNEFFAKYGLKSDVVRPGFGMSETVIMFSESQGLQVICADRTILETESKLQLIDENAPKEDKKYLVNLGSKMHGHEIVILGNDDEALPEGDVGEITLTGPSVCRGYYKNPELTQEIFGKRIKGYDTPFLRTGDLGLLWESNLYFSGRIKDIIIIRGRNYYPHDIEFVVPKIEEVCPDCVIAYPIIDDEKEEKLALGIEIESSYLTDIEKFKDEILPGIDSKVIKTIGDHFQIYPSLRTYLRPGTIKKTTSGKIKHSATIELFEQEDFHGFITRLSTSESEEDIGELGIRETILAIFRNTTEQEPILDEPIVEIVGDSMNAVEFIEAVEDKFQIPDFDILDHIDETLTLDELIELVEEKDSLNMVAI